MSNDKLMIYKFGGASVKSADGVKNLASIVSHSNKSLVIVVSAMGKTTNALEKVLDAYLASDNSCFTLLKSLKEYHFEILNDLYPNTDKFAFGEIETLFDLLEEKLRIPIVGDFNFNYDQIVSFGELISTRIVSTYLNSVGIENSWVDAREVLRTDSTYREGIIDFEISKNLCDSKISFSNGCNVYITQGFIGGTIDGFTTTLGREGSDYTAAVLANLLDAKNVTIWKDVDGVLNADPRIFPNTVKLDKVSFKEAIELAYCGAQIIHPKTIKPLQNKQIPLHVKSFVKPQGTGTLVYQTDGKIDYPPIIIVKPNQVLVTLTPRDYSFVIEDCLSKIFAILYRHRVKANLVQSSAISFSICVDDEKHFLPNAVDELSDTFTVRYNQNLNLLTIRHFTHQIVDECTSGRELLLQQKTRTTIRLVMR